MRKRRFALLVLLCFWLQVYFSKMPVFGAQVNIIIPLVLSSAMLFGEDVGGYAGLLAGLLTDIKWSTILGLYGLSYYLIGFISGRYFKRNPQDNIAIGLILTGLATLFDFGLRFLISKPLGISCDLAYFFGPIFVEMLLNIGAFWFLWQVHKRWIINWRLRY